MSKEVLSTQEAAEYLGYSYGYFSDNVMFRDGFPDPAVVAGERRWKKKWLEDYLDKSRVKIKRGRKRQSNNSAICSADSA